MLRVKDNRGTRTMMKTLQTTIFAIVLAFTAGMTWAAQTVTYYHLDALGSPIAATNEQGNVLWREAYEPYGNRIKREAASDSNKVWYTGKQEDVGAGLSYFGARWYDPVVGRFMGIDPAGVEPGNVHSFNRYAYANNNPYKYTDPDGRNPVLIGKILLEGGKQLIKQVLKKGAKKSAKKGFTKKPRTKAKDRRAQDRARTEADKRAGRHRGDMTEAHKQQKQGSSRDLTQKEQDIKKAYPDQAARKTIQRAKDAMKNEIR